MTSEPTVYVVDDDAAVRDSLVCLLETSGLSAHGFSSASEFLEQFDRDRVACLVLDLRMPGMDGLELQHRLAEENRPLPVILVTAHGPDPESMASIQGSETSVLQKPFDGQELLRHVREALVRAEQLRRG